MYQRIGQFLSEKLKEANYGDGYIDSLSDSSSVNFTASRGLIAVDFIVRAVGIQIYLSNTEWS